LRRAAAHYLTTEFHSATAIDADNIFATPGVASGIDALAWSVCNEGEGIMVPQPFYNGFSFDVLNRSNVKLLGVTYASTLGYKDLEDVFDPEVNKRALEDSFQKAKEAGITVRALLISKWDIVHHSQNVEHSLTRMPAHTTL
jgi:DNA-binding transcriptional MocR family regulator